jgi:ribose 5-phosphate isomerase B
MQDVSLSMGSDHRGVKLKNFIYQYVAPNKEEEVTLFNISVLADVGAYDDKPVDYPDIVHEVANNLEYQSHGIIICGSGFGVTIAANRYPHIRAANCRNIREVQMAREHNDINVLCLGSDFVKITDVKDMIKAFFTTEFEGGRHEKRIGKLRNV